LTYLPTDKYYFQFLANNAGYFKSEIEPIKIKGKKGAETLFEVDEHPREVSAEQLAKLPPVFKVYAFPKIITLG